MTSVSGVLPAYFYSYRQTCKSSGWFRIFTILFLLSHVAFSSYARSSSALLPLSATYTAAGVSVCGNGADGAITVTPAGGTAPYTYSWTGTTGVGGTIPFSAGNVSSLTGLLIGYYDVIITDALSNTLTVTGIHVGYAFAILITNSGSISSSCSNTGSIILYGNAGVKPYTHSLNGITYQVSNTFTGLAAGNYTAYMKDAAGCVSSKPITVASVAPVVVSAFIRTASSCSNDGAIELYRTGGIPPYTYSIDNITYTSNNVFSNLAGGTVVTGWVKDSQGCKGSLPGITVTQGSGLTVTASSTSTSTCVVDGTIQFNASGGIPPYSYSINNITFQSSNSFTGLTAGNYYGWVQDSRGCKGSTNANVGINPVIVTATAGDATGCGTSDGTIQLFNTGGVGPFTYSLDGNDYQVSNTFTGLAQGTYSAFVKDHNICIGMLEGIVIGSTCRPVAHK
jgi:hypothetical protein